MWQELLGQLTAGSRKALARSISLVENEREGYLQFLASLPRGGAPVIGITGPPGAGKSTLVDGLIGAMTQEGRTVAVLCVDPSSPFHLGAVLGDRIVPGTVIQFDEYFNYPGWRDGEYKAWSEFARARHVEFEYLGYCDRHEQVAVRVVSIGAAE